MTTRASLDAYTERMHHSLSSKLFFLPDTKAANVDTYVDVGCADGALLAELRRHAATSHLIGLDRDPRMLDLARRTAPVSAEWVQTPEEARAWFVGKTCGVFSSVIHEMATEGIDWPAYIEGLGTDLVAVRDMCLSSRLYREQMSREDHHQIRNVHELWPYIRDWEAKTGEMKTRADMMHFLLHAQFLKSWEHEVGESYLPLVAEEWPDALSGHGYNPVSINHYQEPRVRQNILDATGYDIGSTPTHVQAIFIQRRI